MNEIIYKVNGVQVTTHMAEWYFGKAFVSRLTDSAMRMNKESGRSEFKFWQDGTGYLTINIH